MSQKILWIGQLKMLLSNSEVESWKKCKRQWRLKYVNNFLPRKTSKVLSFGSIIHSAAEVFHLTADRVDAMRVVDRAFNNDPYLYELKSDAEKMLFNYFDWVEQTGLFAQYEIAGVEETITSDISDSAISDVPVFLRSKLDLQVRDVNGDLFLVDLKTTAGFSDVNITDITRAHQARTYSLNKKMCDGGESFKGVFFVLMKKCKYTSRGKPPYFLLAPFYINDHMIENHRVHLVAEADQMARVRAELLESSDRVEVLTPPSPSWTCKWCDFKDVCASIDEGVDTSSTFDQDFYVGNPNERYDTGD
jgi:hypothetical protein